MTLKLIAATAVLACTTAAAYAGEGAGDPFPFAAPGSHYTAIVTSLPDTGSEAYPVLTGRPVQTAAAGAAEIVPLTGSEAPIQTANSLPRGFADGTAAFGQEQSVRRFARAPGGHRVTGPLAEDSQHG